MRWKEKEPDKDSVLTKMWFNDPTRLYASTFIRNFETRSGFQLNEANSKYALLVKT